MGAKGFRQVSSRRRSHEVPDQLEIDRGVLRSMRREARWRGEVGELVQDHALPPRPARKRDRAAVVESARVPTPAAISHLDLIERGEAGLPPR